jgi:hypothetical protein
MGSKAQLIEVCVTVSNMFIYKTYVVLVCSIVYVSLNRSYLPFSSCAGKRRSQIEI